MNCQVCQTEINPERLNFLLETKRPIICVSCSTEQAKMVLMDYAHKTAGAAVIVGNDPESIRLAQRAYRRAR